MTNYENESFYGRKDPQGKVTVYQEDASGNVVPLKRHPVDAREMLALGQATLKPPADEGPAPATRKKASTKKSTAKPADAEDLESVD